MKSIFKQNSFQQNILKTKYIIISLVMVGLFSSCDNELDQELKFGVSVLPAQGLTITDSLITASKGTTVTFNFEGEPDFISLSYERFITTNATLSFSTMAAWGTHLDNTLSVFASETFPGLILDDFSKDSTAIASQKWIDLTTMSNLPTASNKKQKAEISLNDYRGKKLTIAFRYKTEFENDWQPTWIISDLLIDNTLTTDGSNISTYLAATMGFLPFDMWNKSTAYLSESEAGKWFVGNTAAMEIKRTARANALNHDWLISKPITIPLGQTESSNAIAIKNISNRVSSYAYTFDKVGEYLVTFNAINQNYKYSNSTNKSIKILITP